MKTFRLLIIAVAFLLCCQSLLSAQEKWYMSSFQSDEGKELVITGPIRLFSRSRARLSGGAAIQKPL